MRVIAVAWIASGTLAACGADPSSEAEDDYAGEAITLPSDNLIANPSFEANTDGWGAWQSTVSRVARTKAPHGGYVAKVTNTSGTSYSLDDSTHTVGSVSSGASYAASAYVKAATSSAVGRSVRLNVRQWNADGTEAKRWSSPSASLTTSWQRLAVNVVGADAGTSLDVYVAREGSAVPKEAFLVDAVVLRAATAPNANDAGTTDSGSSDTGANDSGANDSGATDSGATDATTPPASGSYAPLPTQPFTCSYEDPLPASLVTDWGKPGRLIIVGRTAYNDQRAIDAAAGGATVLVYLDAIIDNAYGRYHQLLINSSAYGPAIPLWPGAVRVNEWGNLLDFRPGSPMHKPSLTNPAWTKLEAILELMVAENPHMAGFFADDLGSRSWFPYLNWSTFGSTNQADYRAGAIAVAQAFHRVSKRHGLVFMVNGTWNAGNGGGYPDFNQHGCSLAVGGMVENHARSAFWTDYVNSPQWATESLTAGKRFMTVIAYTDAERDDWVASNLVAYVARHPNSYVTSTPWGPARANGLPNGN